MARGTRVSRWSFCQPSSENGQGIFEEVDAVASGVGEGEDEVACLFAGGLFVGVESPAELGMGRRDFAKKEALGDEVGADFELDGVEAVFEGQFDGWSVEGGKGEVAGGDVHFLEHPVLIEAGDRVHLSTTNSPPNQRPAPFSF